MIPENSIVQSEFERIKALSEYNLDYANLQPAFEDLVQMVQLATGMPIILLNIIDSDNLWITAARGLKTGCVDKGQTVCQYTILEKNALEIKDLLADVRFQHLEGVKQLGLRYYYGVPIKTGTGMSIGSLCVVHTEFTALSTSKKELMHLFAKEVMKRLDDYNQLASYKSRVLQLQKEKRILAHDIRGPLSGVSSLADLAVCEGEENSKKELLQYLKLIKDSSSSLLELADDILTKPPLYS
jgi:hypothetical protein